MKQYFSRLFFLWFSALFLLPISATAQAIKKSDQFQDCMHDVDLGAFKNNQWGACYIDEQERLEISLNVEMRQILKESSREQINLVWFAHDQWLRYREAWCKFQMSLPVAPTPYVNYHACLVELTLEQLKKVILSQSRNWDSRTDPTEFTFRRR